MIQIVMDSIVIVDDFSLMSTIEFGVKCNSTQNAIFLMDVFLHHSVLHKKFIQKTWAIVNLTENYLTI